MASVSTPCAAVKRSTAADMNVSLPSGTENWVTPSVCHRAGQSAGAAAPVGDQPAHLLGASSASTAAPAASADRSTAGRSAGGARTTTSSWTARTTAAGCASARRCTARCMAAACRRGPSGSPCCTPRSTPSQRRGTAPADSARSAPQPYTRGGASPRYTDSRYGRKRGKARVTKATAASRDTKLKALRKSSCTRAAEGSCARVAVTSCTTRSQGFGTPTPIWRGESKRAAALRTAPARAEAASLRRTSGIPIGRSRGRPSASRPPGLVSRRSSAPANACAASGGRRFTAPSPASRRTTSAREDWPSSPRARRCSIRRPDGPGAEPRGARRIAASTSSRGSTGGTPAVCPKSAAAARAAGKAASTVAAVARPGRAGGKRARAFAHTAGVRGATGAAVRARAAAPRRPARTSRNARRCAAVGPALGGPLVRGRAAGDGARQTPASRSARASPKPPVRRAAARRASVRGGDAAAVPGAG